MVVGYLNTEILYYVTKHDYRPRHIFFVLRAEYLSAAENYVLHVNGKNILLQRTKFARFN